MELETDLNETACLRSLAQICLGHLRQFSQDEEDVTSSDDTADAFWATRQLAEFSSWCANVGVNREGLGSLDVRLKDVPETSSILLQLLRALNRDLEDLTEPQAEDETQPENAAKGDDDDNDDDSDGSLTFNSLSSSEASETGATGTPTREQRLRQHVSDTIDRLHGQARLIEGASAQHRRKRVELYRQQERPNQVFQGYRELGVWKAKQQFKSASDIFQQRIGESFARRRIRFEYLAKHQRKRAVDVMVATKPFVVEMNTDNNEITESVWHKKPKISGVNSGPARRINHDQQTILSATVATKFDAFPTPIRQEKAESVKSIAIRHPGFPPSPQTHDGRFQCPYCFLDFRDSEAEKIPWSQHVMHDFEPYFCTFEDCTSPFDVPNSFDGLLDHMQSHVPIRYHISDSAYGHKELNEQNFEDHVRSHGDIPVKDMIGMKEASRRKGAFLFEICPFCGGYPDVLEKVFPERDSIDAQRALRGHVKQHMQEIALFLPPYRADIQQDDSSQGSVATNRRSNIDKAENNPDDFVTICTRAECDCKIPGQNVHDDIEAESPATHLKAVEEVNWADVLEGFTDYSRERATDNELIHDSCLYPFIMRFALLQVDNLDAEMEFMDAFALVSFGAVEQRTEAVIRLLTANFGNSTNLHPLDAAKDDVKALQYLLAHQSSKMSQEQIELWRDINTHAEKGSLADVRWHLDVFARLKPLKDTNFDTSVDSPLPEPSEAAPDHEKGERVAHRVDMTELFLPHPPADDTTLSEAKYKDKSVWIEWKDDWHRDPFRLTLADWRHSTAIENLVLAHDHLRAVIHEAAVVIPKVLGYVQNEVTRRIGLVIEAPRNDYSDEQCLVQLSGFFGHSCPSKEVRLRLMHALRRVVFDIHAAGQVHRDLHSANIHVFAMYVSAIVDLGNCFLTGFNIAYSALTKDELRRRSRGHAVQAYRYPYCWYSRDRGETAEQQFKVEMKQDLFSLGLLFLEIAHWKRLDQIMGFDFADMKAPEMRQSWIQLGLTGSCPALDWVAENFDADIARFMQVCFKDEPGISTFKDEKSLPETAEQKKLTTYFEGVLPKATLTESDTFMQAEIDEIDQLLMECEEIGHGNPRTYIVLRMIGRLDLLDQLLGVGFNDYWLPMPKKALSSFSSPRFAEDFFDKQRHILSSSREREAERHLHFAHEKDAPFRVLAELGVGKAAVVQHVASTITSRRYAQKIRHRSFVDRHEINMEDFLEELEVLRKLRHRHLLRLRGSYSSMTSLQILIAPVAMEGDLASYMENNTPDRSQKLLQSFFGCLINAVSYLHDNRIWHWRLNPENILIHKGSVYISGFSQAVDVSSRRIQYLNSPYKSDTYSAPEVGAITTVDASADVWSLGCVFLEMSITLQGETPKAWISRSISSISGSFKYRSLPGMTTELLLDRIESTMSAESMAPLTTIRSMLQAEKRRRPTASYIMKMIKIEDNRSAKFIRFCCWPNTTISDVQNVVQHTNRVLPPEHLPSTSQGDAPDSIKHPQHENLATSSEDSQENSSDPSPVVDGL